MLADVAVANCTNALKWPDDIVRIGRTRLLVSTFCTPAEVIPRALLRRRSRPCLRRRLEQHLPGAVVAENEVRIEVSVRLTRIRFFLPLRSLANCLGTSLACRTVSYAPEAASPTTPARQTHVLAALDHLVTRLMATT